MTISRGERNQTRQLNAGTNGGRYAPRGKDWSQMMSGTAALLPTPTPVLTPYRLGQYLTVYMDGEPHAAKITKIAREGGSITAMFTLVVNGAYHVMGRADLDRWTMPPAKDANIPLLPAVASGGMGWWSYEQIAAPTVTPPRIIYAPAPKQTSAAIA